MPKRYSDENDFSFQLLPGIIGAGIGFLVCCLLLLLMWKLGRDSPQYDRIHAIYFFIGYPSEWLINILCRMRLMYREDFVAVLVVIGVWYTFLGFFIGILISFLTSVVLPKLLEDDSEMNQARKRISPRRWFVSVIMFTSSIGGFILSLIILFHKLNPKNIYVEYFRGIYLFDNILVLILGVVGILFGFILLLHRPNQEYRQRRGISMALVGSILAFVTIGLTIYTMFPVSRVQMCQAHLRDLWLCLSDEYPEINNGKLPNPNLWCDAFREIRPKESENLLKCPGASGNRCTYSINPKAFSNISPNAVFMFDSKAGWNQTGGPEMLDPNNHRGKGCNVVFCNGRVAFIRTEEFKKLLWE